MTAFVNETFRTPDARGLTVVMLFGLVGDVVGKMRAAKPRTGNVVRLTKVAVELVVGAHDGCWMQLVPGEVL